MLQCLGDVISAALRRGETVRFPMNEASCAGPSVRMEPLEGRRYFSAPPPIVIIDGWVVIANDDGYVITIEGGQVVTTGSAQLRTQIDHVLG